MSRTLATLAAFLGLSFVPSFAQGVDARTNGMGGASVAAADYYSAGFTNPALLTRFDDTDDFGVVLPTVGVLASDPDELVDSAEFFSDEFDRIDAIFDMGGSPNQADLDQLADALLDLDGRALQANVGLGVSLARPSKELGFALVIDSRLNARSFVDVAPGDDAAIRGALGSSDLPNLASAASVTGALVTDYGVAIAREFEALGGALSIGVTPKFQDVETYNYRVDANDFDDDDSEDDFTDEQFRDSDTDFNVDLGVAFAPSPAWNFGLNVRNLVSRDVDSVTTLGRTFTYSIEPVATAGAAWNHGAWTFAADVDLTETEPFDFAPGSQFAYLGGELAGQWAQLRLGARVDLESEAEDVVTAGIGLSPWGVFRLDLAGLYGDETYGGSIRIGWSF